MFIGRYGRFMFAPDIGADGGASVGANGTEGGNAGAEVDITDYKALWEQEKKEKLKFKEAFDKKASELSAKEKAERARMSDEEKREAEFAEKEQRYQEAIAKVAEMEVSTLFAENGFDKKDYADLSKKVVELCGTNSHELAEIIVDFVKKSNNSAVANAKNSMIKDGAVPPKTSTAQADTKSDYQLYQESKKKTNNIVEL